MIAAVSLLRAVNVAGHNRVRMEALRKLHEGLGLSDVETYVQSGNVVFRAPDVAGLDERIADAVERECGFRCGVVVRTAGELREVVAKNPFARRTDVESGRLLVVFLTREPDAAARARVTALQARPGPEEIRLEGRELFVHYANGAGRSKLSGALIDKATGVVGTARNWNTVRNLLELAEQRAIVTA